jgi:dTDP-4-amino-4,6-dideoxy-D-galactose acyltransferase
LSWDSGFFGFGVGRVAAPFGNPPRLAAALAEAWAARLRLVYGICDHADGPSFEVALAAGGRFVDAKRIYALNLAGGAAATEELALAGTDACSRRQLRSLAWQAAEYSRFRLDPALPHGSWRRMYSAWLRNSLDGKIADAVWVERSGEDTVGMVTVAHRNAHGQIGLLAVDRNSRGRGVGRRLLGAARQSCYAAGCDSLTVVTQGANDAACRLYEAAGYQLAGEQDIFHFWNDPT